MKQYILTRNFDAYEVIGKVTLAEPFDEVQVVQCVLAPAYIQNDDGSIQLTEFSLIPAENAVNLIKRGVEKGKGT